MDLLHDTSTARSVICKQLDVEELEMLVEAYFCFISVSALAECGVENPIVLTLSPTKDGHGTHTSTTRSVICKQLDVEELEWLLEAYFVQIDGTLNKLSTPREYVDDTEDYINIMLDDKQNHLLQMGVMLTTATLVISASIVVAGTFGINIHIELFDETKAGMPEFLWTIGGGTAGRYSST
ncbi:hypothetical protein REPUB_Repub14bG0129400 [Reevesia pubescens]